MVKTFRKKRRGNRRTKRKYYGGLGVRIIKNEVIPDDIRENNIEPDGTVVFFIGNRLFIYADGNANDKEMFKINKELMKLKGKHSLTSTTVVKKIIIIFLLKGETESNLKSTINKFIDDDKDNEDIIALTGRTIFLEKASTDFSDWIDILRSKNSRHAKVSKSKDLSQIPILPAIFESKSKSKYNSPYAQSLSTKSRSGSSDGFSDTDGSYASSRSSGSSSSSSGRSSSSSSSGRSGNTFYFPPVTKLSADQLRENALMLKYPDYYLEYIQSSLGNRVPFGTHLENQKDIIVGGRHKRRRTFKKAVKVPNRV